MTLCNFRDSVAGSRLGVSLIFIGSGALSMTVGLGSVFSLFGLDGPGFRDSFLLGVCCFVAAGLSCLVAAWLVEGFRVFLPSPLLRSLRSRFTPWN